MKTFDDLIAELNPIFRDVLDQPNLSLSSDSSAENVTDWDSLAHINLIMSIEKKYQVSFGLSELQDLKNVGEMVELILTKISD